MRYQGCAAARQTSCPSNCVPAVPELWTFELPLRVPRTKPTRGNLRFMIGLVLGLIALPQPADLVIENAAIWSDGLEGSASVLAVKDGKFVYVGNSVAGWVGPETRKVDAGGKPVIPGLIDSHIHMLNGGVGLSQLQLRSATSKQDFIQRVKEWAESLPEGKWVLGGRWSVESW